MAFHSLFCVLGNVQPRLFCIYAILVPCAARSEELTGAPQLIQTSQSVKVLVLAISAIVQLFSPRERPAFQPILSYACLCCSDADHLTPTQLSDAVWQLHVECGCRCACCFCALESVEAGSRSTWMPSSSFYIVPARSSFIEQQQMDEKICRKARTGYWRQ